MIVFILYLVYDLMTNIIAFFFIGNIDPNTDYYKTYI